MGLIAFFLYSNSYKMAVRNKKNQNIMIGYLNQTTNH